MNPFRIVEYLAPFWWEFKGFFVSANNELENVESTNKDEAFEQVRAAILEQTDLQLRFKKENKFLQSYKCIIRLDELYNDLEKIIKQSNAASDDETPDAKIERLSYGKIVEFIVLANQVDHLSTTIFSDQCRFGHHSLRTKLDSLSTWELLQLEPGSSLDDIERSYRELSAILAPTSGKNLPEQVKEFNLAILKRVMEARRRLASCEPETQNQLKRRNGYISNKEVKADLIVQKALFERYERRRLDCLPIRLEIKGILRDWLQIEPNLLHDKLKQVRVLMRAGRNFEALALAKCYQCSFWTGVDNDEIHWIVEDVEAELDKLKPYGWLQLKPTANEKEVKWSYKRLETIFTQKFAVSVLDGVPYDRDRFHITWLELRKDLTLAYRNIRPKTFLQRLCNPNGP